MTGRRCNLCGEDYTDKTGHDYDICVSRCCDQLEQAKKDAHAGVDQLISAYEHLHEAYHIQKQSWWRKK